MTQAIALQKKEEEKNNVYKQKQHQWNDTPKSDIIRIADNGASTSII